MSDVLERSINPTIGGDRGILSSVPTAGCRMYDIEETVADTYRSTVSLPAGCCGSSKVGRLS